MVHGSSQRTDGFKQKEGEKTVEVTASGSGVIIAKDMY